MLLFFFKNKKQESKIYSSKDLIYCIENIEKEIDNLYQSKKIVSSYDTSIELLNFLRDMSNKVEDSIEIIRDALDIGLRFDEQKFIIRSENTTLKEYFCIHSKEISDMYFRLHDNQVKIIKKIKKISSSFRDINKSLNIEKIIDENIDPTGKYLTIQGTFIVDYDYKKTIQSFITDYDPLEKVYKLYLSSEKRDIYSSIDNLLFEDVLKKSINIIVITPNRNIPTYDYDTIIQFAAKRYLNKLSQSEKFGYKLKGNKI